MKATIFTGILLAGLAILFTVDFAKSTEEKNSTYMVYYFFQNFRCYSCNKIEEMTHKALTGGQIKLNSGEEYTANGEKFALNLKSGNLVFSALNVDEPANKHFLDDFKTRAKYPVLAQVVNGKVVRYQVLDKVWSLLKQHNPEMFVNYIQQSLLDFMQKH